MLDAFHDEHERVFAVKEPSQQLECIYWRGRLTAALQRPPLKSLAVNDQTQGVARLTRDASFPGFGRVATPRYLGENLHPGTVINGPAIIDESTTTVVVYPGASATVTPLGNYLLTIS